MDSGVDWGNVQGYTTGTERYIQRCVLICSNEFIQISAGQLLFSLRDL